MRSSALQAKPKPKVKVKTEAPVPAAEEKKPHWTELVAQAQAAPDKRHVPQAIGLKLKRLLDAMLEVQRPSPSPSFSPRSAALKSHPAQENSAVRRRVYPARLLYADTPPLGSSERPRGRAPHPRGVAVCGISQPQSIRGTHSTLTGSAPLFST